MGSKKKPAARPNRTECVADGSGPQIIDGFLFFGEKDLLRYELMQHKVINALQALGLKKREMEQAKVDYEQRQRMFQLEIADLASIGKTQESALRESQKSLEETYNLDLSTVTYDDVTGKIMFLGEPVRENHHGST